MQGELATQRARQTRTALGRVADTVGEFSVIQAAKNMIGTAESASRFTSYFASLEGFNKRPEALAKFERDYANNEHWKAFKREMQKHGHSDEVSASLFLLDESFLRSDRAGKTGIAQQPISDLLFPFGNFRTQEFLATARQLNNSPEVFLRAAGMRMLVGGWRGFPVLPELYELFEELFNWMFDEKVSLENYLTDTAYALGGDKLSDMVNYGSPGVVLGVDVSSNAGIGFPGVAEATDLVKGTKKIEDVAPIMGRFAKGVATAGMEVASGVGNLSRGEEFGVNVPKVLSEVVPNKGLSNVFKTIDQANNTITTRNGKALMTDRGDDPKFLIKSVLGFNDTQLSKARADAWRVSELDQAPKMTTLSEKGNKLAHQLMKAQTPEEKDKYRTLLRANVREAARTASETYGYSLDTSNYLNGRIDKGRELTNGTPGVKGVRKDLRPEAQRILDRNKEQ